MVWATHGGSSCGRCPDQYGGDVHGGGARHLFDEKPSHREATLRGVLRIMVIHVQYPVNEEVLHQVFDAYGAEQVVVLERADHVEVLIRFRSIRDAERARDVTHGRCIYEGCCWLDVQCMQPTPSDNVVVTLATCSTLGPSHVTDMPMAATTPAAAALTTSTTSSAATTTSLATGAREALGDEFKELAPKATSEEPKKTVQELCEQIPATLNRMIEGGRDANLDTTFNVVEPVSNSVVSSPTQTTTIKLSDIIVSSPVPPVAIDSMHDRPEHSDDHKVFLKMKRYACQDTKRLNGKIEWLGAKFKEQKKNAAGETLEQVMTQALTMAGTDRSAVHAICLVVSGVNHPSDQQRMLDWIRDLFPGHAKFYVGNDAVAALASGTMGKLHGCVLIAGTGGIVYGVTEDGNLARVAGAGPVLGDWDIFICWLLGNRCLFGFNSMLMIEDYYTYLFPKYHQTRVVTLTYQPFVLSTTAIFTYLEAKVNTRVRNLVGYILFFLSSFAAIILDVATSGRGGIAPFVGVCIIVTTFGVADGHVRPGIEVLQVPWDPGDVESLCLHLLTDATSEDSDSRVISSNTSQSTTSPDVTIRAIRDQLKRAKTYIGFLSSRGYHGFVKDLRRRMRDIQLALSGATIDRQLPKNVHGKIRAMELTLTKIKQVHDRCQAAIDELLSTLHATEGRFEAHKQEAKYVAQIAAKALPERLHCLALRLTNEYYSSSSNNKHFSYEEKLEDPKQQHYTLFSDNVLAVAVVVNSTLIHAKKPANHVFHIVMDKLNYATMRMWFLANLPGKAAVQVQNIKDFTWLNSSYSPVLKQLGSHFMINYYFKTSQDKLDKNPKFQDGDLVVFSEVQGMTELNDVKPRKIKNARPYSFTLEEDTSSFGTYGGGIITQVKPPKVLKFKPMKEAMKEPGKLLMSDFSRAVLNLMTAMFGGIVGQEVVKACSGKFHPVYLFFYFDSIESLPVEPLEAGDLKPENSRYDAQISVFEYLCNGLGTSRISMGEECHGPNWAGLWAVAQEARELIPNYKGRCVSFWRGHQRTEQTAGSIFLLRLLLPQLLFFFPVSVLIPRSDFCLPSPC